MHPRDRPPATAPLPRRAGRATRREGVLSSRSLCPARRVRPRPDETCLERAGIERRQQVPVLGRGERHALALALDDEPRRDRLHASGREAARHLLPQDGGDLVSVQPIEDASRLLRVDEPGVDAPCLVERTGDRVLRDLVEDHAPNGNLRLQQFDEVPGDRLAFAVLVGREQELVGARELLLQLRDDLLLLRVDDVVGLEVLRDVDTERPKTLSLCLGDVRGAVGEVANVPDARLDRVVVPEVAGDRSRLRRGLHYDQALAHRRDTLAPRSIVATRRYCFVCPGRPVPAGSTSSSAG